MFATTNMYLDYSKRASDEEVFEMQPGLSHFVAFQMPDPKEVTLNSFLTPPSPSPSMFSDIWDHYHVRMPCSSHSTYTHTSLMGTSIKKSRWEKICKVLSSPIPDSYAMETAILAYFPGRPFDVLHAFFEEHASVSERELFFSKILPGIVNLALKLPHICTRPLPYLKQNVPYSVTLSQLQASSLLANAFLCTFPPRFPSYPNINFNSLFSGSCFCSRIHAAKFRCIFEYFFRCLNDVLGGTLSYTRSCSVAGHDWRRSEVKLRNIDMRVRGTIEDDGIAMRQVDFANCVIGGGVLSNGAVQEEIRFMICPELILSRLFTERLLDHEALLVTGGYEGMNIRGTRV